MSFGKPPAPRPAPIQETTPWRLDIARLSQRLVRVVIGGRSYSARMSADRRLALYHSAFGLRADAACLLDQLAQANGKLVHVGDARRGIGRRGQVVDLRPRCPEACMLDIRQKLGSDAIETVETVDDLAWRLTPLGRFRTRTAQGERFVL